MELTKGLIGEQDMKHWDGSEGGKTFSRKTSTGGTVSLNSIGSEVDVALCYDAFTDTAISSALAVIGTSNKVTLVLRPGTWTFSANVNWSAYKNVVFRIPNGVVISHGAYTVNIPYIQAGQYTIFDGTGLVTLSMRTAIPEWWGFSSTASAAVNALALQAAINSGAAFVTMPFGAFSYGTKLTFNHAVKFLGSSGIGSTDSGWDDAETNTTVLTFTGTTTVAMEVVYDAMNAQTERVHLGDFKLKGNANATGGILFGDGPATGFVLNSSMKNLVVTGFTSATAGKGYGICVARAYLSSMENILCDANKDGIVVGMFSSQGGAGGSVTTTLSMKDIFCHSNTRYGLYIRDAVGITAFHPRFEANGSAAVKIAPEASESALYIDFHSIYTEQNAYSVDSPIIDIDALAGANGLRNVNFFGGALTEGVSGHATSIISIKSTAAAGTTDSVKFYSPYMAATSAGYVITDGLAQACFIETRAGQVSDTNITGNTIDATTGLYNVRYINLYRVVQQKNTDASIPVEWQGANTADILTVSLGDLQAGDLILVSAYSQILADSGMLQPFNEITINGGTAQFLNGLTTAYDSMYSSATHAFSITTMILKVTTASTVSIYNKIYQTSGVNPVYVNRIKAHRLPRLN